MYKEKVDALLKEAFEATKKLLQENGEKTCVFSDDSDLNVEIVYVIDNDYPDTFVHASINY